MAYNTGNPSGSSDPRDLSDSSADIDTWATSTTADTHPDRLGAVRKTWRGMENEFDADQAARASEFEADQDIREAQFVQLMVSGGYTGTGVDGAIEDYATGITVSTYKEIIRDGGEFWRAAADATLPYTTTGAGMPEGGAFVNVGDGVLRQDLVQPVATFNTVADMVAASGLDAGRKVRTLGYYEPGDGGGNDYEIVAAATGTDDGGSFIDLSGSGLQAKGFLSNKTLFAVKFGAKEDYERSSDSGTDDTTRIQSAINYLAENSGASGGEVVIARQAIVGNITVPEGVVIRGLKQPRSTIYQVGDSQYPIAFPEGSKLVGSSASGPVVFITKSLGKVLDLEIGSTQTRRNAAISTGFGNTNCGVLIESEDSPSGGNIHYASLKNLVIRDQPADGYYICGTVGQYDIEDVSTINCGRHGHVIDDGQLSGRVNKDRPGFGVLTNCRSVNTGGHQLVLGHPDSGVNVPYRTTIINFEGIRAGNDAAQLYKSSGAYLVGEQVNLQTTACSGTSGFSGNTPTLNHAFYVAGRQIVFSVCRFINCTQEYLNVGVSPWGANTYISIDGGHGATGSLSPDNFVKLSGETEELNFKGVTGSYGQPVDFSSPNLLSALVWFNGQFINQNRKNRLVLNNDEAGYIEFNGPAKGVAVIAGGAENRTAAMVHFRVNLANFVSVMSSGAASVSGTTGALSGTTGPDVSLNISAGTGENRLYIENRTGALSAYNVTFLSLENQEGIPQ